MFWVKANGLKNKFLGKKNTLYFYEYHSGWNLEKTTQLIVWNFSS
jgi:hypothetical protein